MLDDVQHRPFLRNTINADFIKENSSSEAHVVLCTNFYEANAKTRNSTIPLASGTPRTRTCTAVCLHTSMHSLLILDLQECHTTLHHCLLAIETMLSRPETHVGIALC